MRELKYYKDLPVRSINKITYPLCVAGADCYIDIDGNKFAFISFRNASKKPFFSLYLLIKEYNSAGTLIKETKFSCPNTYARKGLFVTPEPVPIESECEGIEVFVQLAEFASRTFYNDYWTKRGAEMILVAPKVTSTSTVPFEVQPTKDELLRQEAIANGEIVEEKRPEEVQPEAAAPAPVEEAKPEEKVEAKEASTSSLASGSNFYHSTEEAKPEEAPKSEEAVAEEPKVEVKPEEVTPAPVKKLPPVTATKVVEVKNTNSFWILPVVLGLALVVGILFVVLDRSYILKDLIEHLRKFPYWNL